ncbi:TATA box binding protein associated factor [Zalerion maritima]|uniref:TBP-associated factor 6 n=1 Tax=Zalerion maritima TaxID=339359 RepID=A0AAD5WTD9_9PEZI|nr:TATA box binding protein associated factor [Zalerion maritima]
MEGAKQPHPANLLWNPENVKDVAEAVGITNLPEESVRCLAQDVEYRIGQVLVEAMRFMRAARRTTLTIHDLTQALKVLDADPLYGYDTTRPLRYGEASLGPGQPLFYIEDEEVDFEKLINAPLPKVPRDATFTAHWLAIEGVQPAIPQNPTTSESRSQELLPKPGAANPALAALAGNDNLSFRPAVKHMISTELILYFDKIQNALLDTNPDDEVARLREAALESVRSDPGIQQLLPYFVSYIANQITHHLDDSFCLRQMMELTTALIANPTLFIDPYATSLCQSALTCLLGRKLGGADYSGTDQVKESYELRELAASLVGQIARKFSKSNAQLRPKLVRTCLKHFLDPDKPLAAHYGAILGVSSVGGPEAVRVIALPSLKSYGDLVLEPIFQKNQNDQGEANFVLKAILKVVLTLSDLPVPPVSRFDAGSLRETKQRVVEFLGKRIGEEVITKLDSPQLFEDILSAVPLGST